MTAHAEFVFDPNDAPPYTGICETVEICREGSSCARMPALGQSLLRITGGDGALGPSEAELETVEVFQAPTQAPEDLSDLGPRVLIEQEAQGLSRRFAFVDRTRAGPPGRYFILECREAAQ